MAFIRFDSWILLKRSFGELWLARLVIAVPSVLQDHFVWVINPRPEGYGTCSVIRSFVHSYTVHRAAEMSGLLRAGKVMSMTSSTMASIWLVDFATLLLLSSYDWLAGLSELFMTDKTRLIVGSAQKYSLLLQSSSSSYRALPHCHRHFSERAIKNVLVTKIL